MSILGKSIIAGVGAIGTAAGVVVMATTTDLSTIPVEATSQTITYVVPTISGEPVLPFPVEVIRDTLIIEYPSLEDASIISNIEVDTLERAIKKKDPIDGHIYEYVK